MNILYFGKRKSLLNLLLIKLYCLLQGRYENDDLGQFRFEILVPNLDKRGNTSRQRKRSLPPRKPFTSQPFTLSGHS